MIFLVYHEAMEKTTVNVMLIVSKKAMAVTRLLILNCKWFTYNLQKRHHIRLLFISIMLGII